jgi:transposase
VLVQEVLKNDPFSGHLFAFRGQKVDTMKILLQCLTGGFDPGASYK